MDKDELLINWNDAIENGTFITEKHDVSSVGTPYRKFRTVTVKSQPEIQAFLNSGDYTLRHYYNNGYPQSPVYIEIVPADTSMVPGSGIQASSEVPTTACDRFVAVSGKQQGWHLYAEQSSNIHNKTINGDLMYLTDIV